MPRPPLSLAAAVAFVGSALGSFACDACDRNETPAEVHAGPPMSSASSSGAAQTAELAPTVAPAPTRVMPVRPVPTTSPTVFVTMPEQVQLEAIQYMQAMQAPQPGDAPADPAYGRQIADQLRAVGRTDVVSSGRRIDIFLERGCDATLPRESVVRHTAASLTVLLAHGVLVVRCADHKLQCLQSTRDAGDVLCTHK
jgi:hypothetical protein